MGYCDKANKEFLDSLEISECAKGFYIRYDPNVIYATKEEAEEISRLIIDLITIH